MIINTMSHIKIDLKDIFFLAYQHEELIAVTNAANEPEIESLNLIAGIKTGQQYKGVTDDGKFHITDSSLNAKDLKGRVLLPLQNGLSRFGARLSGVDISLWDLSERSVEFFCARQGLQINVAATPLSADQLNPEKPDIRQLLGNIKKLAAYQKGIFGEGFKMQVKADVPNVLEKGIAMLPVVSVIRLVKKRVQEYAPEEPSVEVWEGFDGMMALSKSKMEEKKKRNNQGKQNKKARKKQKREQKEASQETRVSKASNEDEQMQMGRGVAEVAENWQDFPLSAAGAGDGRRAEPSIQPVSNSEKRGKKRHRQESEDMPREINEDETKLAGRSDGEGGRVQAVGADGGAKLNVQLPLVDNVSTTQNRGSALRFVPRSVDMKKIGKSSRSPGY
jgi:hypothetical protein